MNHFMQSVCTLAAGVVVSSSCVRVQAATLSIMELGDSITAGWNGGPMAGYRLDLYNQLASQGIQEQSVGSYDPTYLQPYGLPAQGYCPTLSAVGENNINGYGGFSTEYILANLAGNVEPSFPAEYPFITNNGGYWVTGGGGTGRGAEYANVVLLMAGTNDYFDNLTTAQTGSNIASIIDWFAINRPGTEVLVASPPPANDITSYGSSLDADVTAENAWLKQNINSTEFPNAAFVDVYDSFLNPDGSIDNDLLCTSDGVHPSDDGYQVIANDFDAAIEGYVSSVPDPTSISAILVLGSGLLGRRRRTV